MASLIAARPAWATDFEVETITLLRPGSEEVVSRYASLGIKNTLVDRESLAFPAFIYALVRALRRASPDIVHTFLDGSTGTWGRFAAILAGNRKLMHSDRSLMVGDTRVQRMLRPYLDRATSRFLPNAGAIANRLEESGVPSQKITVLSSGVDLARYRVRPVEPVRERWGISTSTPTAGFLGRFAHVKRLDILIDSLLRVPIESRPALVMAGDGPEMPAIKARIEGDSWLRKNVLLLGSVSDPVDFLSGIDYLLLSSETEGSPNAVLEAMAMAKPIVATAVSDVPAIVEGTGFLATPGDAESLAAAIVAMQELSADQRAELGARARRRIEDHFDLGKVAEVFWGAHAEVLKRSRTIREAAVS